MGNAFSAQQHQPIQLEDVGADHQLQEPDGPHQQAAHQVQDQQEGGGGGSRRNNSGSRRRLTGVSRGKRKRRNRNRRRRDDRSSTPSSCSDDDDDDDSDLLDRMLSTPKKRKLKTTSRYIYETLFLSGNDFDVVVEARGREWRLHKLYLRQSHYFSSMFSGAWKESCQSKIKIDMVDDNVTEEALNIAFGSLYQDEISIEPAKVIPVLASATLLQLDGLIAQSKLLMKETVNLQTVLPYYEAARMYGVTEVEKACLQWLQVNLLSHMPERPQSLRQVPLDLMARLVGSPDLFVMQTEFSAYVLLRLWLFLRLRPAFDGNPQEAVLTSHKFFQSRPKSEPYFLEAEEGRDYSDVFRRLRLAHLINHNMDMEMLLGDRIIPDHWLHGVYRTQWRVLLRVDQGLDKGPLNVSEEDFEKGCLRCGRTLSLGGQQHMWRWTGFNMGLDLIVTYDRHSLAIRRNQGNTLGSSGSGNNVAEHEALMSTHKKRNIKYRVTVASLNEQKQVTYFETTGVKSASLGRNGVEPLLKLRPEEATFPLLLSFNFMVSTPVSEDDREEEEEEEVDLPVEEVQAQQQ